MDMSPTHSKYIHNGLSSKITHDPTFGVYQDHTNFSLKIRQTSFKYNNKHVFVDGKR